MDQMMPKMDGLEAVKIIRGMGYSRPIIALTANAVVGQADIFLASGFDDFISKPIDMRILDKSLETYIYDKQTHEVKAAAATEKEKIDTRENTRSKPMQSPPRRLPAVSPGNAEPFPADLKSAGFQPDDLPGLNVGRGLALFDENLETYVDTLRSYIKNVPEVLDKLRVVTKENLPEYAINVHGLKSISGWICADGIQARAASLEALAKAGIVDGVTTLNELLLTEAENLINELTDQLDGIDSVK
jgi:CheY-like chemotaxis protein